jgi:hypothetical protein
MTCLNSDRQLSNICWSKKYIKDRYFTPLSLHKNLWWRMTGSNRRPSACKADALPAELILQYVFFVAAKEDGDPYGIRTRVTAVKGRCLNRLTNGPVYLQKIKASNRARTGDLFLTMEALYLLSYGSNGSAGKIRTCDRSVNSR